ncbi:MAG TPA: DUF4249 domain-containing protein [Puia sp.]|jgi:hypothetical protein
MQPNRLIRLQVLCPFFLFGFLLLAVEGCKQSYNPPAQKTNINLLVVDGMLNSSPGSASNFHLSRTQKIGESTGAYTPELQAQLTILGSSGDTYSFLEQGNGLYTTAALSINPAEKYQLQIMTHDGSKYLSDPVPVLSSPPIDSLSWQPKDSVGDVTVSINTHDPANNSHYYYWTYAETWEYHTVENAQLQLQNGLIVYTDSTNQTNTCWKTQASTAILLGNSTSLGADRISQAPLVIIPQDDQRLSVRYSILVSQSLLSQAGYQYWQILQKNTENLGTLFDPQPSQLSGNYHCVTNPNEAVIGYLSAGTKQQLRLFIPGLQQKDTSTPYCGLMNVPINQINWQLYDYSDPSYAPFYFTGMSTVLSKKTCIDCRVQGGTTQKPTFW